MDASKPVVILVHGLWMKGLEMTWLRSRLRDKGYPVRQFQYHTTSQTLADKCVSLKKAIRREHGKVALIGHSHITMLFAPAVAEQCDAFLRNARFARD